MLIGEEKLGRIRDQLAEGVAVAVDAEGIGQRDGDAPAPAVAGFDGLVEGGDGGRAVKAVAFKVKPVGGGADIGVDILRPQRLRYAEIGVHRPLAIGGDQNHTAPGFVRLVPRRQRGFIGDAEGADVMGEDRAELVVLHLAEIGGLRAQHRGARDGVGGGPAGGLGRRAHDAVKLHRPVGVDELHDALFDTVLGQERVLAMGQDVDKGVAHSDHVITAHAVFSSN